MSRSKKIRVPATAVELIQFLGAILRDHLGLKFQKTECWTFFHVAQWPINKEVSDDDFVPCCVDPGTYWVRTHDINVYLGKGYAKVLSSGRYERVELRTRCEHVYWEELGLKSWNIQLWVRMPDGSILSKEYNCFTDYGDRQDTMEAHNPSISKYPPRRIAFWKEDSGS
ncbi:MAG: hypothetical protein V1647_04770 [Pseudomonadota bacterium]